MRNILHFYFSKGRWIELLLTSLVLDWCFLECNNPNHSQVLPVHREGLHSHRWHMPNFQILCSFITALGELPRAQVWVLTGSTSVPRWGQGQLATLESEYWLRVALGCRERKSLGWGREPQSHNVSPSSITGCGHCLTLPFPLLPSSFPLPPCLSPSLALILFSFSS